MSLPLDASYFEEMPAMLLAKDTTLWSDDDAVRLSIAGRLGWVDIASEMKSQTDEILAFASGVRRDGIKKVVLLGMGGSSLCPAVLRDVFGVGAGYPELIVLDTTDPRQIASVASGLDMTSTLFLVASKSGTTIEPLSQLAFFWERAFAEITNPGSHFAVITDPATPLAALAEERSFRALFINPADIGGRYSALSYFGLVPAALLGIDINLLLERAVAIASQCREPGLDNPALVLARFMAEEAAAGRDKMTLVTADQHSSLGLWVEQLVAESTGKNGRGIIPIVGEGPLSPARYGNDRAFVLLKQENTTDFDLWSASMRQAGHPVLEINLSDDYDLGDLFWRFEAATALCGAMLGVNPFDEPNVTESKDKTGALLKILADTGSLPIAMGIAGSGRLSVRIGEAAIEPDLNDQSDPGAVLGSFLSQAGPDHYVALLAYWPENDETAAALAAIRSIIRDATRLAVTAAFGPRYLHSTGQEHKGGPDSGLFIQLTASGGPELGIPGEIYSFSQLEKAQALGDFSALDDKGKPVCTLHLSELSAAGLSDMRELFSAAVDGLANRNADTVTTRKPG